MILQDFHVHTTYCDGKSTAEETVRAAIALGMKRIGFSGHSYTEFDRGYCMSLTDTEKYFCEINELKVKYADKIDILCGIELDVYSDIDVSSFDYVIGSAHYIKWGGEYIPVDLSAQTLVDAAQKYFGGDMYALAEAYYETVVKVAEHKTDIIGHIDLITKFNSDNALFDESRPRYLTAAQNAIDKLLKLNVPFEINTGVIVRGYKNIPYPSETLLKYITENGGKVLLNSDSHKSNMLCFEFEKWHSWADSLQVNWYNE